MQQLTFGLIKHVDLYKKMFDSILSLATNIKMYLILSGCNSRLKNN